jgi:NAD(P)-dependent dehydrogenase (short-subunit alcohol dehydrogenase family)
MLVRQLAIEWGKDGIRCNTVSPGPTHTPMTAAGYADPARRAQRDAMIPLGKLGLAEDVANAILFLIGPQAGHITGVDIVVDGGMSNNLMPATGAGTGQKASA